MTVLDTRDAMPLSYLSEKSGIIAQRMKWLAERSGGSGFTPVGSADLADIQRAAASIVAEIEIWAQGVPSSVIVKVDPESETVDLDELRAWVRAAAGWIGNIADTLDQDHPEWSIEAALKMRAGDFSGARSWADDSWSDYR